MKITFNPELPEERDRISQILALYVVPPQSREKRPDLRLLPLRMKAAVSPLNYQVLESALSQKGDFTMDDIATELNLTKGQLLSSWRNMSKSLKNRDYSPFDIIDTQPNVYRVKPEYRL